MELVERLGELLRTAGFSGHAGANLRSGMGFVPPAGSLLLLQRPDDARLATRRNILLLPHQTAVRRNGPPCAMDLAKQLVRSCVRAFYQQPNFDVRHILVIDALVIHSA